MTKSIRSRVLSVSMLLCAAALQGCSEELRAQIVALTGQPLEGEAKAPKSGVPPEVAAASDEWPMANRTYAGTRATVDSPIRSDNVSSLREAWSFDIPNGAMFGAITSSALVLEGVVYFVDSQSNAFALNAKTGAVIWEHRYDAGAVHPNGLAVGWGKLFVTSNEESVVALDLKTGRELWSSAIEVPQGGGIGIAPIAYAGLVFVSTVPCTSNRLYAGNVAGTLYALHQDTGTVAWSFNTVQDESLWGHPKINSGGGAWYPATVDVDREIVYFGVGNPAPFPGTPVFPEGSSRPGDNLYTNSVLALDAKQGALQWYHQEGAHDLFDLDFQNPPLVVDATIDDKQRRLIIGSGKSGTIVALDAQRQGELLWRATVGKHQNDKAQSIPDEGLLVYPGPFGGVVTPLAYADATIYAPVVNWGQTYLPSTPGMLDGEGKGEVVALNVADGGVRWTKDLPAPPMGSLTVVNDLVFGSTLTGQVLALDRSDGTEKWSYQAPLGINAPMTVSGDIVLVAAGLGMGTPKLIAFSLNAGEPLHSTPNPTPAPFEPAPNAEKLSNTGLYADIATRTLADGVLKYAPTGELWADGAAKQRFIYLPPGAQIDSTDMDNWVFPVGTKVWKEFSVAGKKIETRLLEKTSADSWRRLAFVWDADESDARAAPQGAKNARGTQHDVPNQQTCKACHAGAADTLLGVSAIQLAQGDGLTTHALAQTGRLTVAPRAPLDVPGDDVAREALFYLHANCSSCHNPTTTVGIIGGVNFTLTVGSLETVERTNAYQMLLPDLSGPGGLANSAVLKRMSTRGVQGQMPPVASEQVDEHGLRSVRAWMEAIAASPKK